MREGKNLLRHFGKGSGNLGRGTHRNRGRSNARAEPPFRPASSSKTNIDSTTTPQLLLVDTKYVGPTMAETIAVLFSALSELLGFLDLAGKLETEHWLCWASPKIFRPGVRSRAMRLPFSLPGVPECPHAAPTWERNARFPVVNTMALVPQIIHRDIMRTVGAGE